MLDLVACPAAGAEAAEGPARSPPLRHRSPKLRPARAPLGKKMDLPVASAKREDVLRILQHREVSTPASSTRRPEAATFVW